MILRKKFKNSLYENEKTFLINSSTSEYSTMPEASQEMYIAKYLEAFKLVSYQVVSGERPEYFVRVNSILQIEKILNDSSYHSEMVKLVRERHKRSRDIMESFFTELSSDEDRWDYIERYFVGMENNMFITEKENRQEVKHKKFGRGYILSQDDDKITVKFYETGEERKFTIAASFGNGLMQKLN